MPPQEVRWNCRDSFRTAQLSHVEMLSSVSGVCLRTGRWGWDTSLSSRARAFRLGGEREVALYPCKHRPDRASGHTGNMDFLSASKKGCFTLAFRSFGLKALLSGLRAGIPCYVAQFDLFVLSRNSPELCATRCLGAKSVLGIFLRSMGVRCCESTLARIF